jgi:hypothetical protein
MEKMELMEKVGLVAVAHKIIVPVVPVAQAIVVEKVYVDMEALVELESLLLSQVL